MKIKTKITTFAAYIILSNPANAVTANICYQQSDSACTASSEVSDLTDCQTQAASQCWHVAGPDTTFKVTRCTQCKSSRTLVKEQIGTCDTAQIYATKCKCNNGCTETSWTTVNTAYQQRKVCDANCNAKTEYQCAPGYYGNPTSTSSGCVKKTCCNQGYYPDSNNTCQKCPSISGSSAPTTPGQNCRDITNCYLPAGGYTDETGTFSISGSCFYQL